MKFTPKTIALPAVCCLLATLAATDLVPDWIRFAVQLALINGIVGLGVLILTRAGLISLGQGLHYATGAFAAALAGKAGVQDVFLLISIGLAGGTLTSLVQGFLIARYRGIFFSMLTLASTMIAFGVAVKSSVFGGTDGLNVRPPTFLGTKFASENYQLAMFVLTAAIAALVLVAVAIFLKSTHGRLVDAVRECELRVEFMGSSVRRTVVLAHTFGGALAGLAGAMMALTALHVDPEFANWTTSGEFVFIVLLGGTASAAAPFFSSLLLEGVRAYAAAALPEYWQLVMGTMILLTILFFPRGIWSAMSSLVASIGKKDSSGTVRFNPARRSAP